MSKQPIPMTKVITSDAQILVVSDECNTLWIDEKPVSTHLGATKAAMLIASLLQKYSGAVRAAKDKGIKVKYKYATKKRIQALSDTLYRDMHLANELYESLRSGWEAKMQTGIYPGYRDDAEVERLGALKGQYMALFNHSSPIGQAMDLKRDIDNLKRAVASDTTYSVTV